MTLVPQPPTHSLSLPLPTDGADLRGQADEAPERAGQAYECGGTETNSGSQRGADCKEVRHPTILECSLYAKPHLPPSPLPPSPLPPSPLPLLTPSDPSCPPTWPTNTLPLCHVTLIFKTFASSWVCTVLHALYTVQCIYYCIIYATVYTVVYTVYTTV